MVLLVLNSQATLRLEGGALEGPGDGRLRFTLDVRLHLQRRSNLDLAVLQVLPVDLGRHWNGKFQIKKKKTFVGIARGDF